MAGRINGMANTLSSATKRGRLPQPAWPGAWRINCWAGTRARAVLATWSEETSARHQELFRLQLPHRFHDHPMPRLTLLNDESGLLMCTCRRRTPRNSPSLFRQGWPGVEYPLRRMNYDAGRKPGCKSSMALQARHHGSAATAVMKSMRHQYARAMSVDSPAGAERTARRPGRQNAQFRAGVAASSDANLYSASGRTAPQGRYTQLRSEPTRPGHPKSRFSALARRG